MQTWNEPLTSADVDPICCVRCQSTATPPRTWRTPANQQDFRETSTGYVHTDCAFCDAELAEHTDAESDRRADVLVAALRLTPASRALLISYLQALQP